MILKRNMPLSIGVLILAVAGCDENPTDPWSPWVGTYDAVNLYIEDNGVRRELEGGWITFRLEDGGVSVGHIRLPGTGTGGTDYEVGFSGTWNVSGGSIVLHHGQDTVLTNLPLVPLDPVPCGADEPCQFLIASHASGLTARFLRVVDERVVELVVEGAGGADTAGAILPLRVTAFAFDGERARTDVVAFSTGPAPESPNITVRPVGSSSFDVSASAATDSSGVADFEVRLGSAEGPVELVVHNWWGIRDTVEFVILPPE